MISSRGPLCLAILSHVLTKFQPRGKLIFVITEYTTMTVIELRGCVTKRRGENVPLMSSYVKEKSPHRSAEASLRDPSRQ